MLFGSVGAGVGVGTGVGVGVTEPVWDNCHTGLYHTTAQEASKISWNWTAQSFTILPSVWLSVSAS